MNKMRIVRVVSYLGAWTILSDEFKNLLIEIERGLEIVGQNLVFKKSLGKTKQGNNKIISLRGYSATLSKSLADMGWEKDIRKEFGTGGFLYTDFKKYKVGLNLLFGKLAFSLGSLFVNLPLLAKSGQLDLTIFMVPTQSLAKSMPLGISNFEAIYELLNEMRPLPIKFPFVLLGISNGSEKLQIVNLTSEIDSFLLLSIGLTLDEVLYFGERENYDFKEALPRNEKLAQTICAFTNLKGGGLMMIGISNDGKLKGINKDQLDNLQLKITNVVRDNCLPFPKIQFHIFEIPNTPNKSLLFVQVDEINRKPCVTQDKVYIRSTCSVRPATSDEIRSIVLSNA